MKSRPGQGAAATQAEQAQSSAAPPDPQALRCAGCGAVGVAPRIVHDPRDQPPVVISPVFGWHEDGRPALLCGRCKGNLRKRRGRARYSKARASDGHLTGGGS